MCFKNCGTAQWWLKLRSEKWSFQISLIPQTVVAITNLFPESERPITATIYIKICMKFIADEKLRKSICIRGMELE